MHTQMTQYIKWDRNTPFLRTLVGLSVMISLFLTTTPFPSTTYAVDDVLTSEQRAIALKIQCPVCSGESIAESQADVARNMLAKLIELSNANKTEQEILDYFVDRYGLIVLRSPPKAGFTMGLWLFPPGVLIIGLSMLIYFLRSQKLADKYPVPSKELQEDIQYQDLIEEQVRQAKDDT